MSRSGIKSIAVNTIYLSLARTITSTARIVYAIILARLLGAELYGLFNYGLSWYLLFLALSSLGLSSITIREIGRNRSLAPQLLGQTLAMRTVSTFTMALLSFLLALLIESDPTSRRLLFIFSIALFGRGLSTWSKTVCQAYEASALVLIQEVIFRLLEVLVGVGFLYAGFGIIEIAMVHAASWLLQGSVGLRLIRRYLLDVQMIWDTSAFIRLIRSGVPFIIGGFLSSWLVQGSILMYRHLEGIGIGLGQLALALQALFILGGVVSVLGGAALPVLARSVDRGDGKSDHFVDLVLRGGLLMSGALSIAAVAIGPELVNLLFGPSYEMTAMLLPWTLILIAPYFWMNTLSSMIVAYGRYWMVMLNNALGASIFTLSFPFLVSEFDLSGVVIALALGLLGTVIGQIATLWRYHEVAFVSVIFRSFAAVALAMLVTYLLSSLNQWTILIVGLVSLMIFSALFRVFRIAELKRAVTVVQLMVKNRN